jgi:hypothetical protein
MGQYQSNKLNMHQRHQSTFTNKNIWSDKYYIIGIDFLPLVGVDCRVMVRDPTRRFSKCAHFGPVGLPELDHRRCYLSRSLHFIAVRNFNL